MKKILVGIALSIVLVLGAGSVYAVDYVVYDPDLTGASMNPVQDAMTALGLSFDVRSKENPVTASDLSGAYKALIIGSSVGAGAPGYSGLSAIILETGITGNILLTGHDADYHTWHYHTASSLPAEAAAQTFMSQAISFAGGGGGTGLIAFEDYNTTGSPFLYLPSSYGVSATGQLLEQTIQTITSSGQASGVYAGLTAADMSNWNQSYHAIFTGWGAGFSEFEWGIRSNETSNVVTLGRTVAVPEPSTLLFLGAGLAALLGLRRKLNLI